MISRTRAVIGGAVGCVVEQLEGRRLLSRGMDLRLPGEDLVARLEGDTLVVDGTDGDDQITVRRNPNDDRSVQVLSAGEVVSAFDADEVAAVDVRGWGGNDTITVSFASRTGVEAVVSGGHGDDVIKGGGADDTLKGDSGEDTLSGGAGDDRVVGGSGGDAIDGRNGDDTLAGGQGDDKVDGAAGDDQIAGGGDDDWLEGGAGSDEIAAGSGADEILGGGDDDEIAGQGGDDSVAGGLGEDTINGNGGDDEIAGGVEDDELRGDDGEDTIFGGDGMDTIAGGADPDVLNVEDVDYTKWNKYDTINNDRYRNPLKLLQDEAGLKAWIIDEAVEQWKDYFGQQAWGGWWWGRDVYYFDGVSDVAAAGPVPRDHSTTNVQEQGVDEADLVKTDGDFLYVVSHGELVIVDTWPASEMHVVSRTTIDGSLSGIYLHGNTLTVVSSAYKSNSPAEASVRRGYWRGWSVPQTKITVLDVSDRSNPGVLEETTLDGDHSDTRMIDGRLYVVVNDWDNLPAPRVLEGEPEPEPGQQEEPESGDGVVKSLIYYPYPEESDDRYETEAEFRARLEAMPLEELLPGYATKADGEVIEGRLADFSNFYVPDEQDEQKYSGNMFSVAMFDVTDDEVGVKSSTSVAGLNGQVYASTDSLYVTATTWDRAIDSWDWSGETQTDIYKFDLGIDRVKLGGSGQVPGWIVNQFSLDEEEGILRIATTSSREDGQSNNVFTLADVGKELEIVGGITDLAFSERIYSVRFVGDRGYIVTFRQVDPLFTIDLSDPENPEVKGILKIPGYSSYLHPIGEDLVLGVGRDGTDAGQVLGVQVSLFDVSDMENPKRLHSHTFESEGQWRGGSWSAAEWDHHAFSYFPEQQILALPMMTGGYSSDGSTSYGLHVLHVDRESGFTSLGNVEHVGQAPLRSVRIENALYSIGYDAIRVVELGDPSNVLKVLENVIKPSYWLHGGIWWVAAPVMIWEG